MQKYWLQIKPCLKIKVIHQPLREWFKSENVWKYIVAPLTSSPPSCPDVLTPPQHFSPLTSHGEGCRFRVQLLGFPLSDLGLITRTVVWGNAHFSMSPPLTGQNSSSERESLLRFLAVLVLVGPFTLNKVAFFISSCNFSVLVRNQICI